MTALCRASYEKGAAFLDEAKAQGARVLLITAEKLRDADWPHDALDGRPRRELLRARLRAA